MVPKSRLLCSLHSRLWRTAMQKLILERYIIKLIRAFVIQQVRANKESELSLPVFLPTSSSPRLSVWEIVWLSSSYRAQWTPIVPASVELWRVMMMPLPVSDYPESNSNLIDPTNIATGGLILGQQDGWIDAVCICLNDLNFMQNLHNNRDCTESYFLPFSLAQSAHIVRWS